MPFDLMTLRVLKPNALIYNTLKGFEGGRFDEALLL